MKRKDLGNLGEKIARDFLQNNGYIIIETNYRCREGEIDVIARREETLVFVEVRTKQSRRFGTPEESITSTKMQRLRAVAAHYGQHRENLPLSRRIDVLAIQMERSGRVSRIELIENAVSGE